MSPDCLSNGRTAPCMHHFTHFASFLFTYNQKFLDPTIISMSWRHYKIWFMKGARSDVLTFSSASSCLLCNILTRLFCTIFSWMKLAGIFSSRQKIHISPVLIGRVCKFILQPNCQHKLEAWSHKLNADVTMQLFTIQCFCCGFHLKIVLHGRWFLPLSISSCTSSYNAIHGIFTRTAHGVSVCLRISHRAYQDIAC